MPQSLYTIDNSDQIVITDEVAYVIRPIRDRAKEEKPRELLIKYGPEVLNADDLLAIIFGTGTSKEELAAMTKRIMREYGEKSLVHQKNVKKLMADLDIPKTKACQVVACFELGRRFYGSGTGRAITIRTPKQVYEYLKDMGKLPKEHLRGLYLNNHYKLIHDEVVSIGSVTANIVHPREVFRPAIEYNASAVILAHNHPSGNLKPSDDDIAVTKQLKQAGELLGIGLLDHIVITTKGYQSISVEDK